MQKEIPSARVQGALLRLAINDLNLDTSISRVPHRRDPEYFLNALTLAYTDISDISVAIAASSGLRRADPVSVMLVAPTLDGSGLLVDDSTKSVWTDSFWVYEDGIFKYFRPGKPVQIDGVDFTMHDRDLDPTLAEFARIDKKLYQATDNKQWTKEVLTRAGIRVPRGILLRNFTWGDRDLIDQFLSDNPDIKSVVTKNPSGAHGDSVSMFNLADQEDEMGFNVLLNMLSDGTENGKLEDIILEERIVPPQLRSLRRIIGDRVDWNFRVLTTLDRDHPRVIDAEIRYGRLGNNPINISNEYSQAQAVRASQLNNPRLIDRVYRVARAATRAVCREELCENDQTFGIAGNDLIVDKNGRVYVLEVNTNKAGGFGTLCRLDGKPLDGIRDVLIKDLRPKLEVVHQGRVESPGNLRRVPFNSKDLSNLYWMLVKSRQYELAQDILLKLNDTKGVRVTYIAAQLVNLGEHLGNFMLAEDFIGGELGKINPENWLMRGVKHGLEYHQRRMERLQAKS
jgi:hypothetical protein